jgi:hypothetical protein
VAIASRKQLLDEAYTVLSDPEQCAAYDTSFLAKTYEQELDQQVSLLQTAPDKIDAPIDPNTPSIEIKHEEFVGALLILQELGEYELVIKLGQPYLGTRDSISLDKGLLGDPQLVRPDIVLTLALACMELGREQWQQGQYENAASSLETGQELLLREGLFPSVRGEIQADLYKLRPYRILELLALPEENIGERHNGLRLLQEMLQERMGIDGTGDDQSGLSIDDFLRFIQQLRGYLTAAEQQTLFETESRRPSAVATYLAVYALLARGFAQRQPAAIARAKQMLMRLGRRQDVHLEQAVCALLLGQTEEASKALELSQEYEPLAFIREHSQGAPDLLPGLCLYGERWLQKSVFPHFRDLRTQKASLKEYFADEQVQAYLESLPEPSGENPNEWTVVQADETPYAATTSSRRAREPVTFRREANGNMAGTGLYTPVGGAVVGGSQWAVEREPAVASSRAATIGATTERSPASNVSTLPTAQRVSRSRNGVVEPTAIAAESSVTGLPNESSGKSSRRQRQPKGSSVPGTVRVAEGDSIPTSSGVEESLKRLPHARNQRSTEKSKSSAKVRRLLLLAIASVVGVGIVGFIVIGTLSWVQKTLQGSSAPALEEGQPLVQLGQPPVPIPKAGSQMMAPEGPLTEETAQQAIQSWLSIKSVALGPEHQIDQFKQILTEPALSSWQQRAQAAKQDNSHCLYKHGIKVNSVEPSAANPDRAKVDAAVNEAAQCYQGGQLSESASYNDNLRVQYELVRTQGRWLIKNMAVAK